MSRPCAHCTLRSQHVRASADCITNVRLTRRSADDWTYWIMRRSHIILWSSPLPLLHPPAASIRVSSHTVPHSTASSHCKAIPRCIVPADELDWNPASSLARVCYNNRPSLAIEFTLNNKPNTPKPPKLLQQAYVNNNRLNCKISWTNHYVKECTV